MKVIVPGHSIFFFFISSGLNFIWKKTRRSVTRCCNASEISALSEFEKVHLAKQRIKRGENVFKQRSKERSPAVCRSASRTAEKRERDTRGRTVPQTPPVCHQNTPEPGLFGFLIFLFFCSCSFSLQGYTPLQPWWYQLTSVLFSTFLDNQCDCTQTVHSNTASLASCEGTRLAFVFFFLCFFVCGSIVALPF